MNSEQLIKSAKRKLLESNVVISALPTDRADPMWALLLGNPYNLSFSELSALKNSILSTNESDSLNQKILAFCYLGSVILLVYVVQFTVFIPYYFDKHNYSSYVQWIPHIQCVLQTVGWEFAKLIAEGIARKLTAIIMHSRQHKSIESKRVVIGEGSASGAIGTNSVQLNNEPRKKAKKRRNTSAAHLKQQ